MTCLFQSKQPSKQRADRQNYDELPVPRPLTSKAKPPRFLKSIWINWRIRTRSQSQSLFFTKLPPEIRSLIYKKLLGSRTVHVFREFFPCGRTWSKKLLWSHDVCYRNRQMEFWQDDCNLEENRSYEKLAISVLLSCRRVYSESIKILYSSNIFHFSRVEFLGFRTHILPCHFESITSLELKWTIRYYSTLPRFHEESHGPLWEVLDGLPNLRQLYLILGSGPPPQFDEYLTPSDRLVCKQGQLRLRLMIPYHCFKALDKRGEDVVRMQGGEPPLVWWKFRRVVEDEPNQWQYWVESKEPEYD